MNFRKQIKKILTYPSLPDFYILGAQKAGTTSIDSYLKYHPDFQGSHPKEIHFFDNKKVNEKGLKWYKNHFRRFYFGRKKLLFESTPNYLFNKELPKTLKTLKPDLKFVVILRDPIDRAFSAYNMFKLNYLEQKKIGGFHQEHLLRYESEGQFMSFEEMVNEELKRIEEGIENPQWDESFTLLRKGLYQQQLETWYQFFPKEQFLILQFDDLKQDQTKVLNTISAFLGVRDFNGIKIDKEPRNKREYKEGISEEMKAKLSAFYKN